MDNHAHTPIVIFHQTNSSDQPIIIIVSRVVVVLAGVEAKKLIGYLEDWMVRDDNISHQSRCVLPAPNHVAFSRQQKDQSPCQPDISIVPACRSARRRGDKLIHRERGPHGEARREMVIGDSQKEKNMGHRSFHVSI